MTRAVWSGSISFGLVNVPVKAFTAVRDHTIHFNQLVKGTGARVQHQNVSAETGKPVDNDEIELGYEIKKGRYVTFERDELDDLRPESTRAIEVSDFVALDEVDPIYYERTYWLAPSDDAATNAYHLLLAAMEDRERVGIGTVVMRNKQYLAAVRPLDGLLAMSTLRFADEVVSKSDVEELPARRSKPDAKALKLAVQIVDSLASPWEPERYHDTYTDQLEEIIRRKDKGKEAVVQEAPAQTAKVLDLMAALEASVGAAKKSRSSRDTAKALAKAADQLADEAEESEDADESDTQESAKKSASKGAGRKPAAKTSAAKKSGSKPSTTKKAATKKSPARRAPSKRGSSRERKSA